MDEEAQIEKPVEVKTRLPEDIDYKFAVWLKTNNYALGTVRNYSVSIKNLLKKDLYISPERIKAYLSVKNTLTKRASVKNFLIFLEDMENITIAPFRYPRLKKETKAIVVISPESFDKILYCMRHEFKLFMKLMFYGGLRLSECVRIKTDWFNWVEWFNNKGDYGELKIFKAKRNKERVIPISPSLMNEIFEHAQKHEDGALKVSYLFDFRHDKYIRRKKRKGFPVEVAEDRYVLKVKRFFQMSLAQASQEAIGRKIKSHTLRSSRATDLDNKGVIGSAIRDFLGHDNLATTSRYIVNTPEKLKQQIKSVEG